jgi:hypothetical protein
MIKGISYGVCLMVLVSVFSCKNEDPDIIYQTTNFDKSSIENKTYSKGDTVIADILIKFVKPMKSVESEYTVGGLGYTFENIPVSTSATEYLYKLRFPIDPKKFQNVNSTYIKISSYFAQPLPNNGAFANFLIVLNVKFK